MNNTPAPLLELACPHRCILGEGPVWDAANNVICWLDIIAGEIHEFDPLEKTFRTIYVGRMIGSFAICDEDRMIAGLKDGLGFVNRENGHVELFDKPESGLPGNRFNDGKCDPQGRFWAGTMSHTDEPKKGSLYLVHHNLQVEKKIADVSISNGLAWSPDHQTLYYIDTPTLQVVAFDYDQASGDIANKRTVLRFSPEDQNPDGMTIDTEGMLWIAHWDGWQVSRWNPHTGEKLLRISLPVARVTCCTFGGENLEDLYITTARRDLTPAELAEQPLAGSLFVWKNCGFKGMPAFNFKMAK